MPIVPRAHLLRSLEQALNCGASEDEAVTEIASSYCLPVEAVLDVVAELHAEPASR